MYYPDTIMQIINFISLLITKGNILSSVENYTSVLSDGHKLMDKFVYYYIVILLIYIL